ncbi:unnamed protein product [Didymodactylos carnosus]|uniref:Trigger factor C-terminal domain-containing protein n=1 Tax=Didymodactylos carnosus TaxID=1234261 RepID=A0A8S2CXF7_9BILA|nr:unnamed protein product [Didymodactylos carnosus]CAF3579894.1 unnamed protein product [Didymodactylos carnosus]
MKSNGLNTSQLEANIRNVSHKNLKLALGIQAIADEQKIEVSPEEIEEHITKLATQYNMKPEELKAKITDLDVLEGQLINEKVLKFLRES